MMGEEMSKEQAGGELDILRRRVTELEKRVAKHRLFEKRILRINTILRAVCSINQLMIKQMDEDGLLREICGTLTESRGYYNAWIALLDESRRLVKLREAIPGKGFDELIRKMHEGKWPPCTQRALEPPEAVATISTPSSCGGCPLVGSYWGGGGMSVRLEHSGRLYGFLVVSVPAPIVEEDEEELSLFQEVARDVAFGLYRIEMERMRLRALEILRKSEEKYRDLFENAIDPIFILDDELNFCDVNKRAVELLGYSREEFLRMNLHDIIPPEQILRYEIEREKLQKEGAYEKFVGKMRRQDGSFIDVEVSSSAIIEEGVIVGSRDIVRDITERKRMEEAIRYQAYHDFLTGLPNRMLFMEHLTLELNQARRNRSMLAVLFMDLDRFKYVNDTLGHAVGDQLIREVAGRLRACMRESDTVARIGGDEFTMLLPQISQPDDAAFTAKKIISILQRPFVIDGHELHISTSTGISTYPGDSENAETLLKNADIAMYHAKELGRNNYQFYNPSMNVRTIERMLLENSLRQTIERSELVLFYQPQVNIRTRQVVHMEALVRWQHPELGMLSPLQFIPLAEETGMIASIDEWVLRTACSQNRAWQEAGYTNLRIAVNLSARQFQQRHFAEKISEILQDTGLSPHSLELEISESSAMQNIEHAFPTLMKLNEMGIRFSIDDFGTGCSSLSYLKKLPIRKLKIDKSFVRGIPQDPDDQAIVNAVIAMAHQLKLEVVAEGVETEEQAAFLHSSGCEDLQGFLFSVPRPSEECGALMHCVDGHYPF
ncbi:MAG: EAL domain-containing protein [Alphaproteobacteria bacterium]|uniref:EAL domain-containing protein n=1 Tax=Candidatus Nitrobium versatile TaxID=2884831 RepID=A0A953M2F8_9BACT|nr:EAL domain-containing protein [Candidatus Nitrobium versatile]